MLKQTLACTALISSFFGSPIFASPAEYGTAEEAKALLDRAITAVKANEHEAIAMFNHNDSRYRDRDLFVFCFNGQDGKFTAHELLVGWMCELSGRKVSRFGERMYEIPADGQVVRSSICRRCLDRQNSRSSAVIDLRWGPGVWG